MSSQDNNFSYDNFTGAGAVISAGSADSGPLGPAVNRPSQPQPESPAQSGLQPESPAQTGLHPGSQPEQQQTQQQPSPQPKPTEMKAPDVAPPKRKGPQFFGYRPPKWVKDFEYIRSNKGKGSPSEAKTWFLYTADRLLKMHSV